MNNVIDFDFRPTLKGYKTPEPSLRDLVYKYYAAHFAPEHAEKFTDQYLRFQVQMESDHVR